MLRINHRFNQHLQLEEPSDQLIWGATMKELLVGPVVVLLSRGQQTGSGRVGNPPHLLRDGATLKLWSCWEASCCSLRQELKMRSSVSRSHTFSSLIGASSCSSGEPLLSGDGEEPGPSSRDGWCCWDRTVWRKRRRRMNGDAAANQRPRLAPVATALAPPDGPS